MGVYAVPRRASQWGTNLDSAPELFFAAFIGALRTCSHHYNEVVHAVPVDIAETPAEIYALVLEARKRLPDDSVYATWRNDKQSKASMHVLNPANTPSKDVLAKMDAMLLSKNIYAPASALRAKAQAVRDAFDCWGGPILLSLIVLWCFLLVASGHISENLAVSCVRALGGAASNTTSQNATMPSPAKGICSIGIAVLCTVLSACVVGAIALFVARIFSRQDGAVREAERIEQADSPECVAWCASVLGDHQRRNV